MSLIFKEKVSLNLDNYIFIKNLGEYFVGLNYSLNDFVTLGTVHVFPAQELQNNDSFVERFLIITSFSILTFSHSDPSTGEILLEVSKKIQTLTNLKRKKDDKRSLVL